MCHQNKIDRSQITPTLVLINIMEMCPLFHCLWVDIKITFAVYCFFIGKNVKKLHLTKELTKFKKKRRKQGIIIFGHTI